MSYWVVRRTKELEPGLVVRCSRYRCESEEAALATLTRAKQSYEGGDWTMVRRNGSSPDVQPGIAMVAVTHRCGHTAEYPSMAGFVENSLDLVRTLKARVCKRCWEAGNGEEK